jgi:predicted alpha/beta superfamily hydrolase
MNVEIRVFYPLAHEDLVLRTDADWDRDLIPHSTDRAQGVFEFTVPTEAPFFYFKPCIRKHADLHWSVGANYLALAPAASPRDIYPHFFSGKRGTLTDPWPVDAHPAGAPAREVRVYLPPGYDENELKRYPVLYMHDGANLFLDEEAFGGISWDIDDSLDLLDEMSLVDKVIVVGVYTRDRMNEYTLPGYELYGRQLVEMLKPLVDRRFRTLPGQSNTAVMGSSLGGVLSFYLAWQHPEVFGKAVCMSSTFGYRDDLAGRVDGEPIRPVQIYLDSGWPGDNYEVTRNMYDRLLARGYTYGRDLLYFAFPHDRHNEGAWATRCHLPFQFLFGKRSRAPNAP